MRTRILSFRRFICFAACFSAWACLLSSGYGQQRTIPLVGAVATASPAQTIGINANVVYVCDNNEISTVDVTHASAPALLGTINSPTNTTNTYCDVQKGDLVQMINTTTPTFRAYDLTNPTSPSLIAAVAVNKQFFGPPYYQANTAFFGSNVIVFGSGYPGPITDQAGDFVSLDVTSFNAPTVLGALESQTHGPVYGGSFNVYGTTPYNNQLAYVTATTSQGKDTQTGIGQLWVVNTSNPSAMSMVTQVNVPGTLQVFSPLIQGNTAVTIGDSGGWRQPCCGNNAFTGNVVITVYDITNPQSPKIAANVTTSYLPGPAIGRGAAVIGPHLFLYGGVIDASNNNYFLLVDTTNPASPVITTSQTPASVNFVRVVGTLLYAAADSGLQIYSLSNSVAPGISPNGIQNGASFQPGIAANSWATIVGANLSVFTDTWDNSIVNGKLPTTLDGVSVAIGGKPAYIEYVSPSQINLLVPDIPAGSTQVTVTSPVGTSSTITVTASKYGPAFFPWPNNQPVATRPDYSFVAKPGTFPGAVTVPAKPGDVIILWGTGFGPTSPAVPAGVLTPSDQIYSTSTPPTVTINNIAATVISAALTPGEVGLYQVAIRVPGSLADGDWPIVASIGGVSSPSGVVLSVQH
jgi:uncharacterized protein (TIGR03437 family)